MLFKLSNLNSNLALTLGYLNPALNNSALSNLVKPFVTSSAVDVTWHIYKVIRAKQRFLSNGLTQGIASSSGNRP